MVLVMTVEPGFGGQKFMGDMLPKVTKLAAVIAEESLDVRVQVDGGVDLENIAIAARAGADTFVAGSCVFAAVDRNQRIDELREIAQQNLRS